MPQEISGIKTFKALVRWLAARHHEGHYFPMAAKIGVSSALVDQWQRGVVKRPTVDSIQKVCAAYDLDFLTVLQLVMVPPSGLRRPRPIAGGSANNGTLPIENNRNPLPLLGRWLIRLLWPPRWCPQLVRLDAAPIGS